MSSNLPGPADGSQPEVEYLGDQPAPKPRRSRRTGLIAAAAAGLVVVAGAGAFAVVQFMSAGPAPATAVPSDAVVYVSLDLDPSGGQKVAALETLRKFPALKDKLGLNGTDDLRKWLYDGLTADNPCPDLDFGKDIDPWLGNKIAMAARPADSGSGGPVMFFSVQVKDEQAAKDDIAKIAECGGSGSDTPGTAFTGDYMVVAETQKIADGIVADAEKGSLADDDGFHKWIDEAGGDGIVEAYVSADAPKEFSEELGLSEGSFAGLGSDSFTSTSASPAVYRPGSASAPSPTPEVLDAFKDFQGAAMVVRFSDGALEMELAAGGLPSEVKTGGDSGIEDLPSTTAMALGFGVPDDAVQHLIDSMTKSSGMSQDEVDAMMAQAEQETGLNLPEDLQTLLGSGLSVAVDSSMDFDAVMNGSSPDGSALPVGVRIVGDPDEITPVVDKVQSALGPMAGELVVEKGDGVVALGLDQDYVAKLAQNGSLGDQDRFKAALKDVGNPAGGLYVDFDAGDWLTKLAESDSDPAVKENVAPLDSLGVTGWVEGDVVHGSARLTTD